MSASSCARLRLGRPAPLDQGDRPDEEERQAHRGQRCVEGAPLRVVDGGGDRRFRGERREADVGAFEQRRRDEAVALAVLLRRPLLVGRQRGARRERSRGGQGLAGVRDREDVHLEQPGGAGQAVGQLLVERDAGDHAADGFPLVVDHVDGAARCPRVLAREELPVGEEADVSLGRGDLGSRLGVPVGERALHLGRTGDPLGLRLRVRERVGELLAPDAEVGGQAGVERVALLALGDLARDPGREDDHDRAEQQRPERQSEPTAGRSRCNSRQRCRRFSFP